MNILEYEMLLILIVFIISYYITSVLMDREEDKIKDKFSSEFLCKNCKISFSGSEAKIKDEQILCPNCMNPCLDKIKEGEDKFDEKKEAACDL